jgi:hypothetical protein
MMDRNALANNRNSATSVILGHSPLNEREGMILFQCPGFDRTPGHCYAGQAPNHTFFWVGKVQFYDVWAKKFCLWTYIQGLHKAQPNHF